MTVLLFSIFLTACILFQEEYITELDRFSYVIDSTSVIQGKDTGEQIVFVEVEDSPLGTINSDNLVFWQAEDFLNVMDAFQKLIWKENDDNWEISYVSYIWSCSYFEDGPQSAHVTYVQSNSENRFVSEIYLNPTQNFISGTRKSYSPRIFKWRTIEFSEIQISPEEVLALVEGNGGFDFRMQANNECKVIVQYLVDGFNGWDVLYYQNGGPSLRIKINPNTGEIVK